MITPKQKRYLNDEYKSKRWMILTNYYAGLLNQTDTTTTIAAIENEWIETSFEFQNARRFIQKLIETSPKYQTPPTPEKDDFDWFNHWYPIHVIDTMDATRPHKAHLLGMNLVLWNDGPTNSSTGEKQMGN